MPPKQPATVADIEGPWIDPNLDSGLIQRCKRGWNTPISELTNELLATYLRQKLALSVVVPEARRRVAGKFCDGTELYDEELENALNGATEP